MHKKRYSILLMILVVGVSIMIMILPTFFTQNISRVSLKQELSLPLILNDTKEIKIVFFGYSGCVNICTPRLQALNKFYTTLDKSMQEKVGLEFLDISVPQDEELPNTFASFFNKNFKGIYLSNKVLRDYTKAFNVYFTQSLFDKTEFDHTSNLYIVKRTKNTKELRFIYTAYPFDFEQIKRDLEELQHETY